MSNLAVTPQEDLATYFETLAAGNRHEALGLMREMRRRGRTAIEILTEVITPAQARVGELWATDEWSVAQEHAATAVSEAAVTALGMETPEADASAPLVLVSCVEQEWHALPALIVSEFLRAAGLDVNYLGANISPTHLVRQTLDRGPRAVLLSCSLSSSLVRVQRHVEAVHETGTPVMVGGRAFDSRGARARALGADAFATSGADAVIALHDLPVAVTAAREQPSSVSVEASIIHTDREVIAANIARRLVGRLPAEQAEETWIEVLQEHLPHLVGSVAGALVCADPTVLDEALTWLQPVLGARGAPDDAALRLRALLVSELREHPAAIRLLTGP